MAYMAVGDLWVEGGRQAQVDGLASLFWADGLSIETQPHPLSPTLPASEQRQLSTSSICGSNYEKRRKTVCVNIPANVPTVTG